VLRGIYRRAFLDRIQAITGRLDTLIGEVMALRSEVREVQARQEALERHVQTVIAGGWDTTALARRLAALEDRAEGS
jgi:hypothetical protein